MFTLQTTTKKRLQTQVLIVLRAMISLVKLEFWTKLSIPLESTENYTIDWKNVNFNIGDRDVSVDITGWRTKNEIEYFDDVKWLCIFAFFDLKQFSMLSSVMLKFRCWTEANQYFDIFSNFKLFLNVQSLRLQILKL